MNQRESAEAFRKMHRPGDPVVLPNVWDAAGARTIASLGFAAVASSSAAIAYLEGFADGEAIGREGMLAGVARIVRAVDVPVTADMEAAYGPTIADAEATARGVIASGAVGLNVEDLEPATGALFEAEFAAARIAAIRAVSVRYGVPLVINARTDVYLADIGEPAGRLAETLRRAALYRAAGADCIFVPGIDDPLLIGEVCRGIDAPVNVLANASTPPLSELRKLGVARVSLGSAPYRRAITALRDLALAARDGDFSGCGGILTHAELQHLMERER